MQAHLAAQTSLGRSPAKPAGRSGVAPALFYAVVGALLITNAVTLVGFLMSGDVVQLIGGRNDTVLNAYETRIADLRTEVDRLYSRQYARAGDINLQMQDLAEQQQTLAQQHQYVRALAQMASDLGIKVPKTASQTASTPSAKTDKTASLGDSAVKGKVSDIDLVRARIAAMQSESGQALDALSASVEKSTDTLVAGLKKLGISPFADASGADAMGGPFEPADTSSSNAMLERANAIYDAFQRFKTAREALVEAPVHAPLKGQLRISSPFGPRMDPFLHKRGFHSGIDFPEPLGTSVLSAGAGTVTYAGWMRGYGNLVEIEHEEGIRTRYGHLSAILVDKGQSVGTGQIIGKVGSTGRSTGPHLHFEVRRNGKPTNPQAYLDAGQRLSKFI